MANDNAVHLEEFEGLKCSRPQCGGPADILIEDGVVVVICQHCTNQQNIEVAGWDGMSTALETAEEDLAEAQQERDSLKDVHDAAAAYLTAFDNDLDSAETDRLVDTLREAILEHASR